MSGGKIGIWLIGAWGHVGTALTLTLAGLQDRTISANGLVTEQAEFAHLRLADWSQLVIGGHEIRKTSTTVEARNLFVDSPTVTADRLAALASAMTAWDRNIRTGTLLNMAPVIEARAHTATLKTRGERPRAALQRIAVDLREFQSSLGLSHLIVVNVASVEPQMANCEHLSGGQLLELLEGSDQSLVSASVLYAIAAVQSGHSYLNWTQSSGPSLPALKELALANVALQMGRGGRTDLVSIGLLSSADNDERLRPAKSLLDAVRLCEREHRRGGSGLMTFLSCFFQHPVGDGPDDVASQRALLYDWRARCHRLAEHSRVRGTKDVFTTRLRAYLQLMRFPAVFTALADIFLGFLLTHETLAPAGSLAALLGASSGLYLAGMVFNDLFDRDLDARERPGRPIPSGRITARAATVLASALMILGAACAALVRPQAVEISLMLVGLILAYDGFLKQTPLGPVAMGGCRFLNVMLGASAASGATWASPQIFVALAMGVYVAGVTWFARQEAQQSARTQLVAAATIVQAGIVGLAAIALSMQNSSAISSWVPLAALGLVAVWIDVRLFAGIREPTPRNVQSSVKRVLLAIVLLDATMVYCATGSLMLAVTVAALLIPAATLGRWIFIT